LQPIKYLQVILVFCGGAQAATFVVPAIMAAYWRRATAAGVIAAMLAGAATILGLLVLGKYTEDPMIGPDAKGLRVYYLLGVEPVVWGLLAASTVGVVVSLLTRPPRAAIVSRLFDAEPAPAVRV
jgi:Na+/proline symporter